MMTKEELEAFIQNLNKQAKAMNEPNSGITYELGRIGTTAALSPQQSADLKQAESDLKILAEGLQQIKQILGENFTADNFVICAKRAREGILKHIAALETLDQATTLSPAAIHYNIQMIAHYNQQLFVLAQIAVEKLNATKLSGKSVSSEQARSMREALFGGNHPNEHNTFFNKISDGFRKFKSIIQKVVDASSTARFPIPKSLDDILSLTQATLQTRYSDSETYSVDDKLPLHAHNKWQKGSRPEQLRVLAETIKYLKKDSERPAVEQVYNENQRKEIIKGAMLAVKHQVNDEWLLFDSRLEKMLNTMLAPTNNGKPVETPLDGPTPKESIDAFHRFTKNQKDTTGSVFYNNSKLIEKIEKTANDKPWLDKQRANMPKPQAQLPGVRS